jgi:hypothetical protein
MLNGVKYECNTDVAAGSDPTTDTEWTLDNTIVVDLNEELGSGVEVEVIVKNKADALGLVTVTVDEVNGNGVGTKVFKKRFEPVLVTLHTVDMKGTTKVVL